MMGIFSTHTTDENNISRESIEVNPDTVLPLHAQDALRLYGDSSSHHNNLNGNGSNHSLHRSSSSTSLCTADRRHSFGHQSIHSNQNGGGSTEFEEDKNNYDCNNTSNEKDYSYDNDNDDPINQSHHSLPPPEAVTADLQANTNKAVAIEAPSVGGHSNEEFQMEQQLDLSMVPARGRPRWRLWTGCLCLLLVIASVLIGVFVGTKNSSGGGLEGNKVVIDPDNPNDFPPSPAPTDYPRGDDDTVNYPFPPGNQDGDPTTSAPMDLTNYCPENLELKGVTLVDFNQSIILYGTIRNTTLIGANNNPNATKDIHALPSCQDNSVYGRGLWYTVQGPGAVVRASTCQSLGLMWDDSDNPNPGGIPLDTQLTVFTSQTSTCTDGLDCVTANDDSSCGYQSTVSWYAEEGRLYYIFVTGKPTSLLAESTMVDSAAEPFPTGTFAITLELAPIGTCDAAIDYEAEATTFSTFEVDPARQMQVPHTSSIVSGTLLGARIDMDPCAPGEWLGRGGEIWYRVTGAQAGNWILASTCQGSKSANEFPPRLALYQGRCDQLQCALAKASEVAPSVDRDCGFGYNLNWWAEPGVEYYIMVYKTNFLPGVNFGLTVEDLNPPSNDNCTGAILLEPDGAVTYGSTLRATYTAKELAPTCFSGDVSSDITHTHPGIWFQVEGTGTRLTASLCNEITQFDTKISVYQGSCQALECVTGNDQWCGYQSSVNWESTIGITYYILVHGSTGGTSPSMGDFGLTVFEFQPSANNFCTDAILLEPGAVQQGSTSTANADVNVDSCDYTGVNTKNQAPGVWYKVVGTGSGMRASTCGPETSFDTRISIYKGENCEALKCIIADDNGCGFQSSAYWFANQGETYYILVTGNLFSNFGDFVLRIEEYKTNTINDFCSNAISASTSTINLGSTKNATFDGVETCVVPNTAPGIWYKVGGTGTGMVASTCHIVTDFDTRISVFRGSDCETLECVAGNDDSHESSDCGSSAGSRVSWLSQIGVEYHILVHGWGALVGTFGLMIEEVVPLVANDFCITSIDTQVSLGNETGTTSGQAQVTFGNNIDATIDNVPVCGDVEAIGHGIWYRSVGTGNRLVASTCNRVSDDLDNNFFASSTLSPGVVTDFDTQISVFRGGCRTLECVGANNDRCGLQSAVNFFVNQGEVFYVLVHGASDSKGSFGLVLEEIFPQVANDFCDTATPFSIAAGGSFNSLVGSTEEASYDTVEECIVPNTSPGVWYRVTGTGRRITVTTCGVQTTFDTRLSVFTGSCQSLECVTGNDDTSRDAGSCGLASTASWLSVEGQTYFIRVHGWGSLVGTFQLTISEEIS